MNEKSEKLGGSCGADPLTPAMESGQFHSPQVTSYLWTGVSNIDGKDGGGYGEERPSTRYCARGGRAGLFGNASATRLGLWVTAFVVLALLGQRVYYLEQRLSQVEGQLLLILTAKMTTPSGSILDSPLHNFLTSNAKFASSSLPSVVDSSGNRKDNYIRLVRQRGVASGVSEFISEDDPSHDHPMLRFRRDANAQNSKEDQDLIDNVIITDGGAGSVNSGSATGSFDMTHCPCSQGKSFGPPNSILIVPNMCGHPRHR